MFRCQISGKVSQPGEKPQRIVTKTRPRQYYKHIKNPKTKVEEEVLVAVGFEIVEEKLVLKETAQVWEKQNTLSPKSTI